MKINNSSLLMTILIVVLSSKMAFCATPPVVTVHIEPTVEDNFSKASFFLRLPEKVKKPRYILVLVPGYNGNGNGLLKNEKWLAFAEQTQGAIVACTFKSMKKGSGRAVHYAAAQHGSGAALEKAIKQLDAKDQHSLKDLPLLIYGHSAGGQFAYGFSCHNPKRMIGFGATKGGYYFPKPIDGSYEVPGLIVSGQKDLARRRIGIRKIYELNRAKGAPWCWLEDNTGHGQAKTLSVVIPYFTELLRMQLGGEQGLPDRSKLVGVSVDLVNKEILNGEKKFSAKDTDLKQGWLPSKSIFDAWSQLDIGTEKYAEQEKSDKK
jgi:poly(3-hydroxybutyrate) depolymerase